MIYDLYTRIGTIYRHNRATYLTMRYQPRASAELVFYYRQLTKKVCQDVRCAFPRHCESAEDLGTAGQFIAKVEIWVIWVKMGRAEKNREFR